MASTTNLDSLKKSTILNKSVNRKPSIPVRQTITSKIRSERGNQLAYLQNDLQKLKETAATLLSSRSDITSSKESIKSATFKKPAARNITLNRKSIVSKSTDVISRRTNSRLISMSSVKDNSTSKFKNSIKSPVRNTISVKSTQSECKLPKKNVDLKATSVQKNYVKMNLNKTVLSNTAKLIPAKNNRKIVSSTPFNNTSSKSNIKVTKIEQKTGAVKTSAPILKPSLKTKVNALKDEKKTVKVQSPFRKSLSAMHLKRVSIRDPNAAIYRSRSAANVSHPTIDENESSYLEIPIFNTPMAKRRSIYNATPMTVARTKNLLSPWSGCWSPTAQDLKRRLSAWMEKNGKPYNSFHHLRCFGMHYLPEQEENKENVELVIKEKDSSYEDLQIKVTDAPQDDISVAYEAMAELEKLISDGYSVDQCEAWLDVIRTRFEELEEKPQYWECMAAIDEARGNMKDHYKNVENTEDSLEHLFQKFNVLNLTPSKNCAQSNQKRRTDLDNSNIFRSTKINFAVKENLKQEDKKFLATPVKRSTRQSTAGRVTPGIIICSSLGDLDSSVRNQMQFRANKALKK